MNLVLTTAGASPVSLAEAKKHCRADYHEDDDAYLDALVSAATEWVQKHTGRTLSASTWTLTLDAFPDAINLPMPPANGIESVTYLDADGAAQTLASTQYRLYGAGGFDPFMRPAWSTTWPVTAKGEPDAVTIVYTAGGTCPAAVKRAILLVVGHLYETREASTEGALQEIPFGVDALLKDYRQRSF